MNIVFFAEQVEHANHCGVRLSFTALVLGDRIGMHTQQLGHLIRVEVELPARDDEFFAEAEFWHFVSLTVGLAELAPPAWRSQDHGTVPRANCAKIVETRLT